MLNQLQIALSDVLLQYISFLKQLLRVSGCLDHELRAVIIADTIDNLAYVVVMLDRVDTFNYSPHKK